MVSLLLSRGAQPNVPDNQLDFPLHLAPSLAIAILLLGVALVFTDCIVTSVLSKGFSFPENGARPDLKNLAGKPAFAGLLTPPTLPSISSDVVATPGGAFAASTLAPATPDSASSAAAHRFQLAQQRWTNLKDTDCDDVLSKEVSLLIFAPCRPNS
jgi:hypothetical protein